MRIGPPICGTLRAVGGGERAAETTGCLLAVGAGPVTAGDSVCFNALLKRGSADIGGNDDILRHFR
jgi:hypothetical protein